MMKSKSRRARICDLIYETLRDGEPHSTKEIREKLNAIDDTLLVKRNALNSELYYLTNGEKTVVRTSPEHYALNPDISIPLPVFFRTITKPMAIQMWQETADKIEMGLINPDYKMSAEEFCCYQEVYELNNKVKKLLKEYLK